MLLKVISFYGRFTLSFTAIGFVFRSLFWRRLDADFSGQTWIVTGGSGGIGEAIVAGAARAGAHVMAVARNPEKLGDTCRRVAAGDAVTPMATDLSLKSETEALARRIIERGVKIDVLVNNVGVLLDEFSMTTEGHETSFAINILNHFLLTERLLEANLFNRGAVIINMASGGMYNAPLMIRAMDCPRPERFNGTFAYAVHKRGQAALTEYWQQKYGDRALSFYVMHPGWADTAGVKRSLPKFRKILKSILRNARQGADTAIWLAATKPAPAVPAPFWFDRKPRSAHAYARTMRSDDTAQGLAQYLQTALDK